MNAECPLWVIIMWVDPNLNDFYTRVSRIEKTHAKGYGFEAPGTVTRDSSAKSGWKVLKLIKPLVFLAVVGICLKATIHYYIGAQIYESRVSVLAAGDGIDPVGAWFMQADPMTLWLSAQLATFMPG